MRLTPKKRRDVIKYFYGWECGVKWIAKELKLWPSQVEYVLRETAPRSLRKQGTDMVNKECQR